MKCPLTLSEVYFPTMDAAEHGLDCLGEECSWFNRKDDLCAIAEIAAALTTMVLTGGKLE